MNRTNPIILQINQRDFCYTRTEKKLLDFFLKNPSSIENFSITEIARSVGVSEAAVTRFSKKAGYSGFNELKLLFSHGQEPEEAPQPQLLGSLNSLTREYVRHINDVSSLMDAVSMDNLIRRLEQAGRIKIYCTGECYHTAEDLAFRLQRLGFSVQSFTRGYAIRADAVSSDLGDVILTISLNGKDRDILFALQQAKKQGAACALITHFSDSPMIPHADHYYVVPSLNSALTGQAISSQLAVLFLCDYLLSKLASSRPEEARHSDQEFFSLIYSEPL